MSNGDARRAAIKLATEGSSDYYVFPINPYSFQQNDNLDMSVSRTIDGYSVENLRNFDGRICSMVWGPLPNKVPYSSLLAMLVTFVGKTCNLKLNYLAGGGEQDTPAIGIRVIDVRTEIRQGLGPKDSASHIVYDSIELLFVKI